MQYLPVKGQTNDVILKKKYLGSFIQFKNFEPKNDTLKNVHAIHKHKWSENCQPTLLDYVGKKRSLNTPEASHNLIGLNT